METKQDMKMSGSPLVFWCYCIECCAEIMAYSVRNSPNLNDMVPQSMMTGEITEISDLCNFQWNEWVKFRHVGPEAAYLYSLEHLGHCLGPAKNKGNSMSQHVLLINGKVIPIQKLRSLTPAEIDSNLGKKRREKFDKNIKKLYGDSNSVPSNWVNWRIQDDDGIQYIDVLNADETNEDLVSPSFENEDELKQKTLSMPQVGDIPDFDAVKNRVKKRSHKYGIEIPQTVQDAYVYMLDNQNNNALWRDAVKKEMTNVMIAFKILDIVENLPVGFSKVGVHMVFDITLSLTRKARLVADGHLTSDPVDSTYAGVMSRELVRIASTYAVLLGIDIWSADIMNTFV